MSIPSIDEVLAERDFAYGQVVTVLADVFGAENDRQVRSLRGKLKRFQLDGLAPPSVGRGRAIAYKIDDIYDWGFALTLDNLGFDPRFVVKSLKRRRFRQVISVKQPKHQGFPIHLESDTYLVYFPSMFFDCLDDDADPLAWVTSPKSRLVSSNGIRGLFDGRTSFTLSNLSDLKRRVDHAVQQIAT